LNAPVILFDGVCNFCNSSVNFIIKRDPKKKFRFSPLQSDYARLQETNVNLNISTSQTIILIQGEKLFTKSRAALEIARQLTGLWPILYFFIIVPPFIRDFFYDVLAKNRYKWFGKKDQCMIPQPEDTDRFVL